MKRRVLREGYPRLLMLLLIMSMQSVPSRSGSKDEVNRVKRLAAVCRLWGTVKYFHPCLAYRSDLDWDAALVVALPKVNAASSPEEFGAAVAGMLNVLKDPATRLVQQRQESSATVDAVEPVFALRDDGILTVRISDYPALINFDSAWPRFQAVEKEIPKARAVLFDLRARRAPSEELHGLLPQYFGLSPIKQLLSTTEIPTPGQRLRMHNGLVASERGSESLFYSALYVTEGENIEPAAGAKDVPAAFLINSGSELPQFALGLKSIGKAFIVTEDGASDDSVVQTYRVMLTDGLQAQVRLGELVYPDGTGGFQPDMVMPTSEPPGTEDAAFQAALGLLTSPPAHPPLRTHLPALGASTPDRPYREMSYPAIEYRLLAVFKIWNAVHFFYPYKDLMGEDWDALLEEFIPRIEAARSAQEYALTLSEMLTRIHDSHGQVICPAMDEYFGAAPPPFRIRIVEGKPLVTGYLDEKAAQEAGIEVGDEIVKVDGEEVQARIQRYARYIPASTPQGLRRKIVGLLLNGAEGSALSLTIRDRNNQTKELKASRKKVYEEKAGGERTGDVFRVLPGDFGYADLDRLNVSEVDQMFEKFKATRGIVFDMRGYPAGNTGFVIASRLAGRHPVVVARGELLVLLSPNVGEGSIASQRTITTSLQSISPSSEWKYGMKTVMLIDERAQSFAEETGLMLKSANQTTFIGTPTAGADGNVTNLYVPGGILIQFTGVGVTYPDGRQLQRVGLIPDIEVAPTIAGIRSGRDEVLEAALEFLRRRTQ
ncbi:MAG TPA: S41 family peptidase [Terriglobia bacterium]|nr:S41 family peptidase [Terriglobia bacterium]